MIKAKRGFALVEVVIVVVLLSGALLVFLEALSQAKSVQVKSQTITTQSFLLHSKINELRSKNEFIARIQIISTHLTRK